MRPRGPGGRIHLDACHTLPSRAAATLEVDLDPPPPPPSRATRFSFVKDRVRAFDVLQSGDLGDYLQQFVIFFRENDYFC